jgi:hypothetical protein
MEQVEKCFTGRKCCRRFCFDVALNPNTRVYSPSQNLYRFYPCSYGWTMLFSFAGRGLPPGAPYTLIYNPNSADPSADLVCLGSDTVGRLGQIFLVGNIEL